MRADEIIKKYHNNSEVQQKVFSARAHGTVSPCQLDFTRNVGTAVGKLNSSYVTYSDTLMASGNMSLGSSRQQSTRKHMENMLQKIRNVGNSPNHLQESQQYPNT